MQMSHFVIRREVVRQQACQLADDPLPLAVDVKILQECLATVLNVAFGDKHAVYAAVDQIRLRIVQRRMDLLNMDCLHAGQLLNRLNDAVFDLKLVTMKMHCETKVFVIICFDYDRIRNCLV